MAHTILFGETIRNLRKSRGWSQKTLSEKSGVNQGFISEIESGKKSPGFKTLKALSMAFSVSIDDLVSGETDFS